MKVRVIDDFCDDNSLEIVIQSAYNSGFGTWAPNKGQVGSGIYEGVNFVGEHAFMLRSLIEHTGDAVIPGSMFFRLTVEGTEKAYIHSDREYAGNTCIVYLSEHDSPYGTAFYRHRPTGLIEMPSFAEMEEMGILEQLKEDMVSRDEAVWEQVDLVEGKFNRAVVFEAPLFHSRWPVEGLGSTIEDGRLIWATHFYKLKSDGSLH